MSEDYHSRSGAGRSPNPESITDDDTVPPHVVALMRHFVGLRDNTHGGSTSRQDKNIISPTRSNCWTRWQVKYSAK